MKLLMLGKRVHDIIEADVTTEVELCWSTGLIHAYHDVDVAILVAKGRNFDETTLTSFRRCTIGTSSKAKVAETFGMTKEELQQLQDEHWTEIGP